MLKQITVAMGKPSRPPTDSERERFAQAVAANIMRLVGIGSQESDNERQKKPS
jgi:hypothetical protein